MKYNLSTNSNMTNSKFTRNFEETSSRSLVEVWYKCISTLVEVYSQFQDQVIKNIVNTMYT